MRNSRTEVRVRQAGLLRRRKIRENLYQVHLGVVLSGILQHHPGRQHQIDFTVGTRTISPNRRHVPTAVAYLRKSRLPVAGATLGAFRFSDLYSFSSSSETPLYVSLHFPPTKRFYREARQMMGDSVCLIPHLIASPL